MVYPYGRTTLEVLQNIYKDYHIACECDADDKGYSISVEEVMYHKGT